MKKVVILGAGILGLYTAYRLAKENYDVTLLEKSDFLGGALRSYHIDGYDIEQFYHHFFTIDNELVELFKELGLEDKILFNYATNGFYHKGRIYPLLMPSDLIGFRPLSLTGKFQLGLLMARIKLLKNPKELDRYTAKEWITKVAGKYVYENLFKVLLRSKFGENHEKASAAWFVERINLRSHVDKNGEKLGYLKGGFSQLIEILKNKLIQNKGEIIMKASVNEIAVKGNKAIYVKYNNKKTDCDYVISSIPPFILTNLIKFPERYEIRLNQLEYQPAICVLIGLDRKVTEKFYWVNIMKDSNSFGAMVEHTNLIPAELYNGTNIAYLASYVEKSSRLMRAPEEEVFKRYFQDLTRLFPHITLKNVKWFRVSRDFNTGLIYKKGIASLIPEVQTPIRNVFIGGMFNSYPERSVAKSVQLGGEIVEKILNIGIPPSL
ncbi:NAD(P)/FAD-dependent oxidoreductase [Candidatus Woesearchaeota archaeon]|nr:NAD(P)/FAD-dependent oxidoreductase [Candidatus Woesearchaeota archaeon]